MINNNNGHEHISIFRFTMLGIVFGAFFPLISWLLKGNPNLLYLVICSAPVVLGIFTFFLGQAKLEEQRISQTAGEVKSALDQLEIAQKIANMGSWRFSLHSKKLWWSDNLYEIFQIDRSIVSKKLYDVATARVHPDDKAKLLAVIDEAISNERGYSIVYRIIVDEGSIKFIRSVSEVRLDPLTNEKNLTGTSQDITQQKILEDQLLEAQSISKIGSWQFDLFSHRLSWSTEHYKIFEIEEPQTQENLFKLYRSRVHPDDLVILDKLLERAMNFGENFKFDHRVVLDGGARIKYVQGLGRVLIDQTGKAIRASGTCRDRTAEHNMELQLQQERSRSAYIEKYLALGELSAGAAHEINNPLAIIVGSLPMLRRTKGDPEKFEARLEKIENASRRIAQIIEGLRKFSRSGSDSHQQTVAIEQVLKQAIVRSEQDLKSYNIPIQVDLDSTAFITCDPSEIEIALFSVFENAIHAASQSAVKWVKVRVFDQDEQVVVQIIDSGHGVDPEIEAKIYQPFFTTKPIGQGIGLGLSVTKGILDQHKASFAINRQIKSTCFEMKFHVVHRVLKAG